MGFLEYYRLSVMFTGDQWCL